MNAFWADDDQRFVVLRESLFERKTPTGTSGLSHFFTLKGITSAERATKQKISSSEICLDAISSDTFDELHLFSFGVVKFFGALVALLMNGLAINSPSS